ncbi:hypothetical protein [Actinomadura sp. 6N118]|uniref:hypothetical protein n=1 Tax=Actinomadura sp. 6N118 TaxID=3375151 RepID=UPI0037916CB0
MAINNRTINRDLLVYSATVVSWGATPFMLLLAFLGQTRRLNTAHSIEYPEWEDNGLTWLVATLGMAAAIGMMAAVVVGDTILALRDRRPKSDRATATRYVVSIILSLIIWLFGGLVTLIAIVGAGDCGSAADAPCLDQPGPLLSWLVKACMILPTLLLPILFSLGRFSRACLLLAPPLIVNLYLLGFHLSLPHMGFGSTTG